MKTSVAAIVGAACAAAASRAQAPGIVPPSGAWIAISTEDLRASFDTLWAVSDVHGRLAELEQLLVAANLATWDGAGSLVWNPAQRRQLFVAVGDYIDGGPDGVGVVLLFDRLSIQAAAAGSRVVALLGNHDAAFLANPGTANRRLLSSAHRSAAALGLSSHPTGEELAGSEFGHFLRTLPIAAFIGSWLFAHAGYIDASDDPAALRAYFGALASSWERDGVERYRALLDPRSIVSRHDWWKRRSVRSRMTIQLEELGLNGIVFGHDPDALGFRNTVAMDPEGWLIKLDTGLKAGRSRGMLLRCAVAKLLRGARFAMTTDGKPNCHAVTPEGTVRDL